MIFLKYANDRFDEHLQKMIEDGQDAFLEMKPFYTKDNVFNTPECARWAYIMGNAKQPDIAIKIDPTIIFNQEVWWRATNFFTNCPFEKNRFCYII